MTPPLFERTSRALQEVTALEAEIARGVSHTTLAESVLVTRRSASPFCWQSRESLRAIRGHFSGEERATALAIYTAMTEVAAESGHPVFGGFKARRRYIAEKAGCTVRTLDKYAHELESIGLLRVERRRAGGEHLPNIWHLDRAELSEENGTVG